MQWQLDPYLTLYIKINLKWINDLSISGKTIKHLEENTRVVTPVFGNRFLYMTQKARGTKEKIDNYDFIKIKNVWESKDFIKKVKRQPIGWENIFPNHISDKGLVIRVYKELLQPNNRKTKNNQRTWIHISAEKTYKWQRTT